MSLYGLAVGASLAAGMPSADANLITLDLTSLAAGTRTTPVGAGFLYFQVNAATPGSAVGFGSFSTANFRMSNTQGKLGAGAHINGVLPNNSIAVSGPSPSNKAARFTGSNSVGPANNFAHSADIGFSFLGLPFGNFGAGDTGYLGLKFTIGPNPIYGWANITVNSNFTVTLNTLGYEDSGRPAHVPVAATAVPDQGSSMLLLAIGAAGLAAFRGLQRKAA